MRTNFKMIGTLAVLAGTLSLGAQAYAQTGTTTATPPAQSDMSKGGPWTQGPNERRELREEREQIRAEHEQLQAEHDRLKARCMDARGQDRSQCEADMKALHEKREALHERMKALQTKVAAAKQSGQMGSGGGKWKSAAPASTVTSQPAAAPAGQ